MIVTGKDLVLALCEALKMDPGSEITKITIVSACDDVARVQVERLVRDAESKKLAVVLSEYALVDYSNVHAADTSSNLAGDEGRPASVHS